MATKIRLARGGSKKRPFYKIVVADSRAPRDGKFIEKLGTYNPLLPKDNTERLNLNIERITHWLSVGATPSETVEKFLVAANLMKRDAKRQSIIDIRNKKSQDVLKAKQEEEAAKKKAEEEAAKAVANDVADDTSQVDETNATGNNPEA